RLLLAEDNPVNQEVAATMLRKRGHIVMVVNNGREAVQAIETKGPFDLVLMDIQMPELDGFAATREIRKLAGMDTLPIIALTAHALTGERERCLAQGMNGYVPKPFRPQELFSAVETAELARGAPVRSADPAAHPPVDSSQQPAASDEPPAVDLVEFRRAMKEAGIEDSADRILDLFVESGTERLEALTTAAESRDGAAMARSAHAFRSPAGAIGAGRLAEGLLEIELAGKAGMIDQACAAFERVQPEARKVLAYLTVQRGGG
ncbi:MAG: response regulator, partial [Gemmatimonadota bacterium]